MSLHRFWITTLLLVTVSMLCVSASQNEAQGPGEIVHDLYKSAQAHFGFDKDTVKAAKPWVAPELYAKMLKKVNQPVAKGDAPDIEGDLFLDSQEPPDKFEIGKSDADGDRAHVAVTLIWPTEKRHQSVYLKKIDGAWKVLDVAYGGTEGKLSDLLK